ncbi:MAG: aminomethyl-transferring glycine dehydrogenase [Gemmatimonadetes bacterium]|nr:aminomethyl-transferring glycine dehydrogenase [Gemmatimonadota bacterium]
MSHLSSREAGERFASRHIGPRPDDMAAMARTIGYDSVDDLIDAIVPECIRLDAPLDLPPAETESSVLERLRAFAAKNQIFRSCIGMGYSDCVTPPVLLRNVLENPGWYTAYTPYQPEIAQGRLEALLTFQTMVGDLTGLPIANASLLDEATAAAEAMALAMQITRHKHGGVFLVDQECHPQTIAVVETRAAARGIEVRVGEPAAFAFDPDVFGALVQYPSTYGAVPDFRAVCERAHRAGALVAAATDLLALTMLTPPGEWGADIAVGNSQRFGVPLGYGGPHAAFLATREDFKRLIPGRIIGVSQDVDGRVALRMALQTREQHIRRDKATSNICTAQVLLAVLSGLYAVYHGPEGLRRIAQRVHRHTGELVDALRRLGYAPVHETYFDTILVEADEGRISAAFAAARDRHINLRPVSATRLGIALDETTSSADLADLIAAFAHDRPIDFAPADLAASPDAIPEALRRTSRFLDHPVFHRYRSETEMLRYLKRLEDRDLSLTSAMIPLGSCTMKLNATTEMEPISWPEFAKLHPFAPREQARGYTELMESLERWLAEMTGFHAISLQPNAGAQGEFTGLLVIRAYHTDRGEGHRDVCLIPQSAHGTNPASAVMAGMRVVVIKTDERGNIDLDDLAAKASRHEDELAALMVTYPSTHGVFEEKIRDICDRIHQHGGQVYLDGANLNAQLGLCRPGDYGADICHLNLHKTFSIPHGGGGPGMGPIGVAEHLAPYLPDHPVVPLGREKPCGTVSAAPWGSPSILPISWAYIAMMGPDGLTEATKVAILNANYIMKRLEDVFPLLYSGQRGLVGHEGILDTRIFKKTTGIDVEDISKRLMDYGFHPPTVSFPVVGTLMVEPTESESKRELDRFCDAMIGIRDEILEVERGEADRENNLLTRAPHTLEQLTSDDWDRPYGRQRAAFPSPATRQHKVWPSVGRIDAAYGDRHLVCACPPIEEYSES